MRQWKKTSDLWRSIPVFWSILSLSILSTTAFHSNTGRPYQRPQVIPLFHKCLVNGYHCGRNSNTKMSKHSLTDYYYWCLRVTSGNLIYWRDLGRLPYEVILELIRRRKDVVMSERRAFETMKTTWTKDPRREELCQMQGTEQGQWSWKPKAERGPTSVRVGRNRGKDHTRTGRNKRHH